jgi:3-methyladenine DNA glycosylase AlkD
MTLAEALAALKQLGDGDRAIGLAKHHKMPRQYLGIPNGTINDLAQYWRQQMSLEERVALATELWATNIFEAQLAAAKLLTQARINPDVAVWALIKSWVPEFDSWAHSDHVCLAGQKRLIAAPARIKDVEAWTRSDHHWTRRAAMVITLPWAKQNHPKPQELEVRQRVLGWAARYVRDEDWAIQKSVGAWLRDLGKHDPERVEYFLATNAKYMKPFARKNAQTNFSK